MMKQKSRKPRPAHWPDQPRDERRGHVFDRIDGDRPAPLSSYLLFGALLQR